jgi:hypothetical protein
MGRSETINKDRTAVLLEALHIDPNSFNRFLEWVLSEPLILVIGGVLVSKKVAEKTQIFEAYFNAAEKLWPQAWGDVLGRLKSPDSGVHV